MFGADLRDRSIFLAAFPAGIGHELLVGFFLTSDDHFRGIDNHDEIARVKVRRKHRLVYVGLNLLWANAFSSNPQQRKGEINKQKAKVNSFWEQLQSKGKEEYKSVQICK